MRRLLAAGLCVLALTAGCSEVKGADPAAAPPSGTATAIDLSPGVQRLSTARVDSIAATVPEEVRRRQTLLIGGTIDNTPPLSCFATDDRTPIGFEYDIAVLVAQVLGLRPERQVTAWENLFLGVDSGRFDVGFSNIAVTEERKKKYDFATYRTDLLAVEAGADADLEVRGPADLAGRTVALSSGTNQEQLILGWSEDNRRAGRAPIDVQYYQKASDYYLALQSGRVDAYVGPNPTVSYHAATSGQTKVVGVVAKATGGVTSTVAAMSRRGSGMAAPVAAAVNELIRSGRYAEVLQRWGLSAESVPRSEVNPPGIPANS